MATRTMNPNTPMSDEASVRVWRLVDDVALRLKGAEEQPTRWEIFREALSETIGGVGSVLKWVLYGIGALVILNVVQTVRRK